MTLDEAIKHCEEMAEKNEEMCRVKELMGLGLQNTEMMKCARTHKQLAEWLTELKQFKEQEPCEDAISRQAVLAIVGDSCLDLDSYEDTKEFCDEINELPSVNPQEPKTGHWIDVMVGDMPAQACDQCNTFYPLTYTGGGHKYCPNCGAEMRGEEE